jgi:ribulose-phosphate 3-epimerase
VAPSVLSADFSRLGEAVRLIETSGGSWVHLDVMDGQFVPNITFGSKVVGDLRPLTELPFDVHLMTETPERHIESFRENGADYLTFHLEAVIHAHRLIQAIRAAGAKPGISIVPSTPARGLSELLPDLDLILVMTVNPGFGGQSLIRQCVDKVRYLDERRLKEGYSYRISVDGGVNGETAPELLDAGADVLVTGSAFFSAEDPSAYVRQLQKR